MMMVTEVAASRRDTNSEQETTQTTRDDREQKAVTHPVASLGSPWCGTWQDSAVVSVDGRDAVGGARPWRVVSVWGGVQLVPCVVPQGSRAAGRQGGSARPGSHAKIPELGLLAWQLGVVGTLGLLVVWKHGNAHGSVHGIQHPASSMGADAPSIPPLHMGTALYMLLPRRIRLVYGVLRTWPWITLDAGGLDDIQGPEQKKPPTRSGQVPSFSLLGGFIPKRPGRPTPGRQARPQTPGGPPGSSLPGPPPGSHRGNFSQQFGQRPRPRPDGARTPFSIFLFERPVQKRHAASLISRFRISRPLIPPHPRRLLPLSASFCLSLSGISSYTHTHTPIPTPPLASRSALSTLSHLTSPHSPHAPSKVVGPPVV